jgi:hypothetical protein
MPIQIYTRMRMYNWWGIILQVEVNQYRLNGHGNGGPRSQLKTGEAVGGIAAAYVACLFLGTRYLLTYSSLLNTTKELTG